MRQIGLLLLLLGIASSVMQFMDWEMTVMAWIDNWGEGTAWGIRGGFCVLGALLIKAGKPKPKQ